MYINIATDWPALIFNAYFVIAAALISALGTIVAAYIAFKYGLKSFYAQSLLAKRYQIYSELYNKTYHLKKDIDYYGELNEKMDRLGTFTNNPNNQTALERNQEELACNEAVTAGSEQTILAKKLSTLISDWIVYFESNMIFLDDKELSILLLISENIKPSDYDSPGYDHLEILDKKTSKYVKVNKLLGDGLNQLRMIAKRDFGINIK